MLCRNSTMTRIMAIANTFLIYKRLVNNQSQMANRVYDQIIQGMQTMISSFEMRQVFLGHFRELINDQLYIPI